MFDVSARRALVAALGLCVVATLPLIVTPTITVRGGFDFDRVEDLAHAIVAALTAIALVLVQRRPRRPTAHLVAGSVTAAAIVAAEVAQAAAPGRSPALADAVLGLLGAGAGLASLATAQQRFDATRLRWVAAISLAVLGGSGVMLVS